MRLSWRIEGRVSRKEGIRETEVIVLYLQQGGGDTAEQQFVQHTFVLQHQFGELMRHREDGVEVSQRNQFAGARRNPAVARPGLALGTVAVAAGVEGEAEIVSATGAAVAVFAERGGAATLDSPDDFMLRPGDAGAAALDEASGPGTENVGHLQGGPIHFSRGSPAASTTSCSASSGLAGACRGSLERCTYNSVSRRSAWPNRRITVERSVPASTRWVAKLWRSVWG